MTNWEQAIASILLHKAKLGLTDVVLAELFRQWPGPEYLCRADARDVANVLRPCGLRANMARKLIRFSNTWLLERAK